MRIDVLIHLHQGSIGLWQPEHHLHGTVQLHRDGESGPRLLDPSHLTVQRAEAEVAVGHERAYAELIGQGESLAVVGFGRLALRELAPRRMSPRRRRAYAWLPRSWCAWASASARSARAR